MVPPATFVAQHHPIGLSTGVFPELRGDWPSLSELAGKASPYAVELSALAEPELPGLLDYLQAGPSLPFRYISIHAPTKERALDEAELVTELGRAPQLVRVILTHPDVIEDADLYRPLGWRLCIENMDSRKSSGQLPDDLEQIFQVIPDAGFVFDIAHAHEVDPSMELAGELLDRFRSRLRHVHLSSIVDGHHVPLTSEDEDRFTPLLARCRDVPWILEAAPPDRWPLGRRSAASSTREPAAV